MPTRNSMLDKLTSDASQKSFKTLDLQAQREVKAANPRELPEPKEPEADWRLAMRKKNK
jgi:hypothetical protein